jgi:hypothetical protein
MFHKSLSDDLVSSLLNDLVKVTVFEQQNNTKTALGSVSVSLEDLLEKNSIHNW